MTLALFRALSATFCMLLLFCCGTAGRAQTAAEDQARNEKWKPAKYTRARAATIAPKDVSFLVFRGRNMSGLGGLRIDDRTLIVKFLNALKQAEFGTSIKAVQLLSYGTASEDTLLFYRKSSAAPGDRTGLEEDVIDRFGFQSVYVYTSYGPRFFKALQDLEVYQSSVIRSTARAHLATARSVTIGFGGFDYWEFTDPKEVRKLLEALSQAESRAYRCTDNFALKEGTLSIQTKSGKVIVVDICISRVEGQGDKKLPEWLLSFWEVLKLKMPQELWRRP